jgi:CRP-like cAMP-binding protein
MSREDGKNHPNMEFSATIRRVKDLEINLYGGGRVMDILMANPDVVAKFEFEFFKNYPLFQYTFVHFLSEHLSDCSRIFEGDLQQMLILAVIGQSCTSRLINLETHPESTDGAISASRLADVCGIPRETVRRKLKILEHRGWIVQNGARNWSLALEGEQVVAWTDLLELNHRGIKRLARIYATFERLMGLPEGQKKWPFLR